MKQREAHTHTHVHTHTQTHTAAFAASSAYPPRKGGCENGERNSTRKHTHTMHTHHAHNAIHSHADRTQHTTFVDAFEREDWWEECAPVLLESARSSLSVTESMAATLGRAINAPDLVWSVLFRLTELAPLLRLVYGLSIGYHTAHGTSMGM